MRYSFLDLLACPITHESLVLTGEQTVPNAIPEPYCASPKTGGVRHLISPRKLLKAFCLPLTRSVGIP